MSSSKNRKRKLRPHERALADQATAAARNLGATDPTTAVFTTAYADPGIQCCWCDCPDTPNSPHYTDPDYVGAGCPTDALYVLHVMQGTPAEQRYPACERHNGNMHAWWVLWAHKAFGGVPAEVHVTPVLDDEND